MTVAYRMSRPDFLAPANMSSPGEEWDLEIWWWIDWVLMKVMVKPFVASLIARWTEGITWPWRGYAIMMA